MPVRVPVIDSYDFHLHDVKPEQVSDETETDKETYRLMYPTGIVSSVFLFSAPAFQWLWGMTTDDGGMTAGNFTLLGDLLARMALTPEEVKVFCRPLMLSASQVQYSEEQLPAQWNIGRKRIRNLLDELTRQGLIDTSRSRVAFVMTFPCLLGWKTAENGRITNPFIHEQREEQEVCFNKVRLLQDNILCW